MADGSFMNWLKTYREKLMTAEEAAGLIHSGERVWVHAGCAEPQTLVQALIERAPELRDVELVHIMALGAPNYADPALQGHFRHNAMFIGDNSREAVAQGLADYTPVFLHEIEGLFLSGQMPLDAVFMQLSPPDEHGYMSLGVSVDCTLTAARCAPRVIAEVNQQMPRALGDAFIHVGKLSAIVETSRPLLELTPPPSTELQHRIAQHVASLIPDGATLQTGIGGIPDAVLSCLASRKDLGVHSEIIADGVIPLIESGVINGERKTLHPGKVVAGIVLGTGKLFRFLHDNPIFEFHPTMYVNDPFVIAKNDNMVSINSALQVDLTGQVCADSLGTKPYSGFGGQVDFVRGAARSRGGKPVIALPSTARDGTVSRIVPVLDPGAGVVTSRGDVHYVVTEHGIAYLHGKTLRQRAEALIAVADPKFRDTLGEFACRAHYLAPKLVAVP
jgi:acyl-CoA hydrolase